MICNLTLRIIVFFKKKSHLLFAFLESKILQLTEKKHTFVPAKRKSSFTIKGSYQSGQMGLTATQLA